MYATHDNLFLQLSIPLNYCRTTSLLIMTSQKTYPFIGRQRQSGVVLIIAMLMLIVISIASVNAMRSSTTSEVIANNSRGKALAMQAAEAGLRHCEARAVNKLTAIAASLTPTETLVIDAAPASGVAYKWEDVSGNWDSASATMTVTPLTLLNATGTTFYKRAPECMVQYLESASTNKAVITARGFGPEVAAQVADTARRPLGSEVWLQSNIQVSSTVTSTITPPTPAGP